ncbi:energy-coupling factor transporter ATPase [Miniphocaeibacter halophilus]|uniref:Energy-coupling factor transporter ATPase n=1 Tax=Miniphocaeibacter halophilus TaxID=2931922 RepID=A0AC61MQF8_9FIRM|nr:energy-coupling factor transporter ATPase [Miniphocaeibacter halophilus]QQK07184.1 energy-coupling factor transporter ATPase [Miniphocaeibacter halophilus]
MEDNIIEIKDVKFNYDAEDEKDIVYALKGINMDIKRGEFIAILGHNGCGKSTLAKLINAQMIPNEGDITVNGLNTREEKNIWDIRKTCGMVFQNPDNQIVATIVEEDVAFGPENLGVPMPQLRERVDNALKTVDMLEYKMHSPALLSGGQKQRIAIAGILAMNPDCILLDEPTAMLDPNGRKEIVNTITRLNDSGKTIILITHFMEEAILADRIFVMNDGLVELEGEPKAVFSNVQKMKQLGLDVPQVTELAYELKTNGFNIESGVLNIDDLVNEICK